MKTKLAILAALLLLTTAAISYDSYWFPTDHGELTGLVDDDHPQYLPITGARRMTGPLYLAEEPAATYEASTKYYVDSSVVTDHGGLTGLTDDDHPQYFLADGTRAADKLPVSGATAVEFQALQNRWAFKYADALGADNTGLYFNFSSYNIEYRLTDVPFWTTNVISGNVTQTGSLYIGANLDSDYFILFDGKDSNGIFKYMEDEAEFSFDKFVRSSAGFGVGANDGVSDTIQVITQMQAGGGGGVGLQYKTKTMTFYGGILTDISEESDWNDL